MEENIYKSVLHNLSLIPEEYLSQVNSFLMALHERVSLKEQNRREILALAGAWESMEEDEFQSYLKAAKESGNSLFNQDVEL